MTGPVVTTEMFSPASNKLARSLDYWLEEETAKLKRVVKDTADRQIKDAYLQGLRDGYVQGVAAAHHGYDSPPEPEWPEISA